jgi:hypothetical protein
MTTPDQRPYASRFAIRFAIILALAMLPAGVIAVVQTTALEAEVQARSEVVLMGATLQAAAAETSLIGRVRGMVGSLAAAVPAVLDDPDACNVLMLRAAAVEPTASGFMTFPATRFLTASPALRNPTLWSTRTGPFRAHRFWASRIRCMTVRGSTSAMW